MITRAIVVADLCHRGICEYFAYIRLAHGHDRSVEHADHREYSEEYERQSHESEVGSVYAEEESEHSKCRDFAHDACDQRS